MAQKKEKKSAARSSFRKKKKPWWLKAGVKFGRQVHQKKSPRSKTLHGYQLSSNVCTTTQLRVRSYCNHLLEQVPPCAAQWWNPAHASIPARSPLMYAHPCEQLVFTRDSVCPAASTEQCARCLPRPGCGRENLGEQAALRDASIPSAQIDVHLRNNSPI